MAPSANKTVHLDLSQLPKASRYVLAYSGGMDSTALLHLLAMEPEIKNKLMAIHVNHGLQQEANQWVRHCQATCANLNIPLHVAEVELSDHSELSARNARIGVFRAQLNKDDCLLTAHHSDDQLETMLFRFLRGTGLDGLCGMQQLANHEIYHIYRPLLHSSKTDISEFVKHHQLPFVCDPSNENNQYSRNFIRNELVPFLQSRQADVKEKITLTLKNLSASADLMHQMIGRHNPSNIHTVTDNRHLPTYLYHWLNTLGVPAPSHHRLQQFAKDCLSSGDDKQPRMVFGNHLLWFWKERLYCLDSAFFDHPPATQQLVLSKLPVTLQKRMGVLLLHTDQNLSFAVTIKYRQNQAKIKLANHHSRKKVKNLFQEDGIAPWLRQVLPYVYHGDRLLAVGNLYLDEAFSDQLNTLNAEFEWQSPAFLR